MTRSYLYTNFGTALMSDTEKTIAGDMSDFALDLLDGIILMIYIFDTGATHVLSSSNVHNMLSQSKGTTAMTGSMD